MQRRAVVCAVPNSAAEAERPSPSAVAMFEIGTMLQAQRLDGERAAARLMPSVAQQLPVNLRPEDLVCRCAGDRLVVLMADTAPEEGRVRAEHRAASSSPCGCMWRASASRSRST